ncbi:MAG: hypothetical protein HLX50_03250 [Alteromonadaceae bacterium]|nr:hypothetical protein [Alteromonadaceae bacterium]
MVSPLIDRDAVLAAVMKGMPVSAVSELGALLGKRYAKRAWGREARWVERLVYNLEFLKGRSLTQSERWDQLMAYGEQVGRVYAEIPVLPRLVHGPKFRVINEQIAHSLSDPFLVVMPHLANWETAAGFLGRVEKPLALLYEPRESESRMAVAMRSRQSLLPHASFISTAQPQPMRNLKIALAQGANALMLPDAPASKGLIPSFGNGALTRGNRWLAARLAASEGVRVLPACVTRHGGAELRLTVHPPLPQEPRLTRQEQALRYAEQMDALFESWVRRAPTDWYWLKDVRLY